MHPTHWVVEGYMVVVALELGERELDKIMIVVGT